MRILILHNKYIFPGGEDAVVQAESELLLRHGHEVLLLGRDNNDLAGQNRLRLALDAFWSAGAYAQVQAAIRAFRPDVMHVHNFFPQFSAAVFWAARALQVPSVMTLHNFRLGCPGGLLYRNGKACEDCLGRSALRSIPRGCYRGSRAQTLVNAGSFLFHGALGTFRDTISRYIALCESSRRIFIAMGLPEERLSVKPNFVDLPPPDLVAPRHGGLFVGRLSEEKGLSELAQALRQLPDVQVTVIGSGPAQAVLEAMPQAVALGWQDAESIYAHMRGASYLLFPSRWREHFPRTIAEAYACGLPVIASRLGAMAELVEEGATGLLYTPGSAVDLAAKIRWAEDHPAEMLRMGQAARRLSEERYSPARNHEQLLAIYAAARNDRPGQT